MEEKSKYRIKRQENEKQEKEGKKYKNVHHIRLAYRSKDLYVHKGHRAIFVNMGSLKCHAVFLHFFA